jgi:endonuclease/exonuclease/phosphatase family metal-dependent hydrolase
MAITYVSWNIKQLGESKMKETSLVFGTQSLVEIASYIKAINADVLAIMEVTLKFFGTDVPALIAKELGKDWGVVISSNDANNKPDRYALIYNTKTIDFNGMGYLAKYEDTSGNEINFPNRYPVLIQVTSKASSTSFGIIVLHGPEPAETVGGGALQAMTDLSNLSIVQKEEIPLLISGDFNVDYNLNSAPYTVFENLKYSVLFKGNKTSLKVKFKTIVDPGTYLKSAYDNIFLSPKLAKNATGSGVYDFVQSWATASSLPPYDQSDEQQQATWQSILTTTRNRVSDHLPVWVTLNI